ncbi:hypothetical protein ABI069_14925, partial [Enterococcus faecium]|uniref:hypothetical protein n=1 Tax=Enterococcus faecium TaxID=1352 RepID=UPI003F424EE8
SWNGKAYQFDADGNLTSDGTRTYTWDERNQLSKLTGTPSGSFYYDPFGRRIGKTIGTTATGFVFDGDNFVQEKSGTGSSATVNA